MEQFFRVGVLTSTHGVHGEAKVFPTTDDSGRFNNLKSVLLDTGKEHMELEIENVKFHKNMVILKFKGFDTIEAIEKYKGKDLLVSRENAVKLKKNENYIADLLGLPVITDEGNPLGTLKDIMQTGANDVYVVETEAGKEVLLPSIKECILDVDLDKGQILVHIMDGLLDL